MDGEMSVRIGVVMLVIYATSLHELAHAFVAHWLGDNTPGRHGRLTFNPIPHLKPVETAIILPVIGYLIGYGLLCMAFTPINPSRFRHPLRDRALVAVAGPLMNLAFMGLLVGVMWFAVRRVESPSDNLLMHVLYGAGFWNLILAAFNLLPLPPLDGYWIVRGLLPLRTRMATDAFAENPILGFVLVIFVGSALLSMILPDLARFYHMLIPRF